MKVLFGAAAVAVIAFVGYFFWGEWSRVEAERLAVVAFEDECHRSWGRFEALWPEDSMIARSNPELMQSIQICAEALGENWASNEDPRLTALREEGAASVREGGP